MKQFCLDSWHGKLTNASEKVTKFGYLKDEVAYRLKQYDITLDMISDKDLQEAKRYLTPDMQDQLYKFASYIPYFDFDILKSSIIYNVNLPIEQKRTMSYWYTPQI